MADDPCGHIAVEEASIEEEYANESGNAELPCLENDIAIPDVVEKVLLCPVGGKLHFQPRLRDYVVQVVQAPHGIT
jgi:hypothetical protein